MNTLTVKKSVPFETMQKFFKNNGIDLIGRSTVLVGFPISGQNPQPPRNIKGFNLQFIETDYFPNSGTASVLFSSSKMTFKVQAGQVFVDGVRLQIK